MRHPLALQVDPFANQLEPPAGDHPPGPLLSAGHEAQHQLTRHESLQQAFGVVLFHPHTGFQYCAALSITASATPRSSSQRSQVMQLAAPVPKRRA